MTPEESQQYIEGFDFIGLEKEPDYCKIAESRLTHAEENR